MSVTVYTFATREEEVVFITTQGQTPEEPLPEDSTVDMKRSATTALRITALWQDSAPYGYRVTGVNIPGVGTTDYHLDNNGTLVQCCEAACSQVDGIAGKSPTTSRKVTVTLPE